LPLKTRLGHPRQIAQFLLEGVQHPNRMAALVVLLLLTRPERVHLSDSCAGQALSTYFNQRFLRVFPQNRLCRGVLPLPAKHSDYVRGRRRQALRTNLRRASKAGISCEAAACPSAAFAAAEAIVLARRSSSTMADLRDVRKTWREVFARPEMTVLIARDRRGRPLAILAAVIDDAVCLVRLAVACDHEARWALHDHLVQLLIHRGACHLLVEGDGPCGALGFGPDVHHFQHLLGYELRHLIPCAFSRALAVQSGRAV
jgi:hypothetical protein